MKKRALEKILKRLGWRLLKEGRRHEIWTNGIHLIPVPRHAELNEITAKSIIRDARELNVRS